MKLPRRWVVTIAMMLVALIVGGAPAMASILTSPSADPSMAATIDSPIGPLTQSENTFLHTNPVNMTQWAQDQTYREQVLALPEMAALAAQENAINPPGAQTSSQLTFWGFFCAGVGTTGCLNNWNAAGGIKFGSGISHSNANGEFNQWLYGQVSYQWPYSNTTFANNYYNNSVYEYAWAPSSYNGHPGSGQCVSSLWGENQGLSLQDCLGSSDELFIWDGNGHWVNVLWTANDYNENPTNPTSWCAGSGTSNTNDGNWIETKSGCSLKWHAYGGGQN
jgi:hypothetical protein